MIGGHTAEELARDINRHFDQLTAEEKTSGRAAALRSARASAFAAIAFIDNTVGRYQTLALIGELVEA